MSTADYQREKFYKATAIFPKSKKELLQEICYKENKSLSKIIIQALEYYYNIDLSTTDDE